MASLSGNGSIGRPAATEPSSATSRELRDCAFAAGDGEIPRLRFHWRESALLLETFQVLLNRTEGGQLELLANLALCRRNPLLIADLRMKSRISFWRLVRFILSLISFGV